MSKGYGAVQRAILAILPEHEWCSASDIAASCYLDGPATDAQVWAVRRAIKRLETDREVERRRAVDPELPSWHYEWRRTPYAARWQ